MSPQANKIRHLERFERLFPRTGKHMGSGARQFPAISANFLESRERRQAPI
jgi:hypothetical protein